MLAQLQEGWASIESLDVDGWQYRFVCRWLDSCNQGQLELLAEGEIRHVSRLALNRLKR